MDPCGFGVDYLRSCYDCEMRFYTNAPDTVRVRWYFVPSNTPINPFPNSFVSTNWDSDPKPQTELGEAIEYGRSWYNGRPPFLGRGDRPCGTAEQWARGVALPLTEEAGGNDDACDCPLAQFAVGDTCADPLFCLIEGIPPDEEGTEAFNGEWHFCRIASGIGTVWQSDESFAYQGEEQRLWITGAGGFAGPFFLSYGPTLDSLTQTWFLFSDWDWQNNSLWLDRLPDPVSENLPAVVKVSPLVQYPLVTEARGYLLTEDGNYLVTENSVDQKG